MDPAEIEFRGLPWEQLLSRCNHKQFDLDRTRLDDRGKQLSKLPVGYRRRVSPTSLAPRSAATVQPQARLRPLFRKQEAWQKAELQASSDAENEVAYSGRVWRRLREKLHGSQSALLVLRGPQDALIASLGKWRRSSPPSLFEVDVSVPQSVLQTSCGLPAALGASLGATASPPYEGGGAFDGELPKLGGISPRLGPNGRKKGKRRGKSVGVEAWATILTALMVCGRCSSAAPIGVAASPVSSGCLAGFVSAISTLPAVALLAGLLSAALCLAFFSRPIPWPGPAWRRFSPRLSIRLLLLPIILILFCWISGSDASPISGVDIVSTEHVLVSTAVLATAAAGAVLLRGGGGGGAGGRVDRRDVDAAALAGLETARRQGGKRADREGVIPGSDAGPSSSARPPRAPATSAPPPKKSKPAETPSDKRPGKKPSKEQVSRHIQSAKNWSERRDRDVQHLAAMTTHRDVSSAVAADREYDVARERVQNSWRSHSCCAPKYVLADEIKDPVSRNAAYAAADHLFTGTSTPPSADGASAAPQPQIKTAYSTTPTRSVVYVGRLTSRVLPIPQFHCSACNKTWIPEAISCHCWPSAPCGIKPDGARAGYTRWFLLDVLDDFMSLHNIGGLSVMAYAAFLENAHRASAACASYFNKLGFRVAGDVDAATEVHSLDDKLLMNAHSSYQNTLPFLKNETTMGIIFNVGIFRRCLTCSCTVDHHHSPGLVGRAAEPVVDACSDASLSLDASLTMRTNESAAPAAHAAEAQSAEGQSAHHAFIGDASRDANAGKFKVVPSDDDNNSCEHLRCSRQETRQAAPGTAAVGIAGGVCAHGVPAEGTFINMRNPENWSMYTAILNYAIAKNPFDIFKTVYLDFGCMYKNAFYKAFNDPLAFVRGISASTIRFFVDWLHAKGHRPWCRFNNGAMYVAGTGRRIGAQCEELWAKMKHNARLWQCMTPFNRLDSFEHFLTYIAASLQLTHFGALLKKNWATLDKITSLSKIRDGCVLEAAQLGADETALILASQSLKSELQSQGRRGGAAGATAVSLPSDDSISARERLGEFVSLAIKVPLLKSSELFWGAIFFFDVTTHPQLKVEIDKATNKLALLSASNSVELAQRGYSSDHHRWLTSTSFADIVTSVREREMSECALTIEALIEESDHCSAELVATSITGNTIKALKYRKSTLRKKIISNLNLYSWWEAFSAADGCASDVWEDTAKAHAASLLGDNASVSSRVFPWDLATVAGGVTLPRRLVLKFLNTDEELARSKEEWEWFLPRSLERAIKHLALYIANIDYILAHDRLCLQDQLAVIEAASTSPADRAKATALVQKLTSRRAYLSRRRAEIEGLQRQGEEAKANWNGKGQAYISGQVVERFISTVVAQDVDDDREDVDDDRDIISARLGEGSSLVVGSAAGAEQAGDSDTE